ncbi:MAG: acyl-CoA dehydrogenase family protein [Acidimicrobiales bacterium]
MALPEPAPAVEPRELRTENEVRDEVQRWVGDSWDPGLSLLEWRSLLVEEGWACPTWPKVWGGHGLPASFAQVVANTLAELGVPGPPETVGMHLAVPTLLEHGSDELNQRLLRSTATGEIVWCQLFSEPAAGSDLAGLITRAERDGDEWVVSGQKVWNTGAAQADLGLLLARTDWDVPKHQGLTYFVLPMRQAAIEVRPLRQMNGHASFNEVFLDEARLPASNVVGEVGNGWRAALTTLAHERRLASSRRGGTAPARVGRAWDEALAEQVAASEPHKWYPQRAGRVDLLVDRAVATGTNPNAVVRQEIAKVLSAASAAKWSAERAVAARRLGRPPGPEGSLGKLSTSNIARAASHAHSVMAGASGMLAGSDAPLGGTITEIFVSVPGQSIAGGTDEIQHNIIAERILGLPKDPSSDAQLPFRAASERGR